MKSRLDLFALRYWTALARAFGAWLFGQLPLKLRTLGTRIYRETSFFHAVGFFVHGHAFMPALNATEYIH